MPEARRTYRLEDLSWPEAQAAIQAGAMAVIPVGSLEQHGRHLGSTPTSCSETPLRRRPSGKGRRSFEIIVATCVEFFTEFATRVAQVTLDFPLTHPRTDIHG